MVFYNSCGIVTANGLLPEHQGTNRNYTDQHLIVLFHNYFSPSGEQPGQRILAYRSEQSNGDCVAIFHKYCYYIKHMGIMSILTLWNPWVCYWYVNIPQYGNMKHGLEYITFYAQKHMATLAVCSGLPLVRDGPLGRPHLWDLLIPPHGFPGIEGLRDTHALPLQSL